MSALPDIKTYVVIIIRTMCHWCRDKQTDQLNRTAFSQLDPYTYRLLIYDRGNSVNQ